VPVSLFVAVRLRITLQYLLNLGPESLIKNSLMLAFINLALVLDFTQIYHVGKQAVQVGLSKGFA
jgi:hypothetical protein